MACAQQVPNSQSPHPPLLAMRSFLMGLRPSLGRFLLSGLLLFHLLCSCCSWHKLSGSRYPVHCAELVSGEDATLCRLNARACSRSMVQLRLHAVLFARPSLSAMVQTFPCQQGHSTTPPQKGPRHCCCRLPWL